MQLPATYITQQQGINELRYVAKNSLRLAREASKQGVRQFIKHYNKYGTIARKPGSGLPPKLSPVIQHLIEQAMQEDDKTWLLK